MVAATLLSGVLVATAAASVPEDVADFGVGEPGTVITPTRLRQGRLEVPAAVTVITSDQIRDLGIRTVAEALRLVPGMAITLPSAGDWRIAYHGANLNQPRRMNVLVDGVSVYRPGLARVDWSLLPVAIQDIERIEVTRGPNSAAYGPNSYLAVVNIMTRAPRESSRVDAQVGRDASGEQVYAAVAGRFGATDWRLAMDTASDDGYAAIGGYASLGTGPLADSLKVKRVHARTAAQLDGGSRIDVLASAARGTLEIPFADIGQVSVPRRETTDAYLGVTWIHAQSTATEWRLQMNYFDGSIRESWRTCVPRALLLPELFDLWRVSPEYADTVLLGGIPSGGGPEADALAQRAIGAIRALGLASTAFHCGTPNRDVDEQRVDVKVEYTTAPRAGLRAVIGGGVRQDRAQSQSFLGGAADRVSGRLFAHLESRLTERTMLNVGAHLERDQLAPASFSPRVALNYRLAPGQAARAVLSSGTRSPDIYEQRANLTLTVPDIDPPIDGSRSARFYQSFTSPGSLRAERILSRELGYAMHLPGGRVQADVKVFDDRLDRLIGTRFNLAHSPPSNDGELRQRGAEAQLAFAVTSDATLFGRYAYLDQTGNAIPPTEATQYARHRLGIGATARLAGWQASIQAHRSAGNDAFLSAESGAELRLASRLRWAAWRLETAAALRYRDSDLTSFSENATRPISGAYNDRWSVHVSARISR